MRRATCLLLAALLSACGPRDAADREALLGSDAARRLVGVWDVTFDADTLATVMPRRLARRRVTGTMVFTLNRSGAYSTSALQGITHDGAYDLDFVPFGFTTRAADAPAAAIARIQPVAHERGSHDVDSLWVVLSPGTDHFAVRLRGALSGDSASGTWITESYSSGGGAGRFRMQRHSGQD